MLGPGAWVLQRTWLVSSFKMAKEEEAQIATALPTDLCLRQFLRQYGLRFPMSGRMTWTSVPPVDRLTFVLLKIEETG